MGRVFEKRKHKMFARWSKMAKGFTKMGKEIAIAVKQGGPHPEGNARLRTAMQNAKAMNMPKDRIEGAIKRASEKGTGNFEEVVYEAYGPYGVAILIETATDNTTRTVANMRKYLSRANGTLGTSGSLAFLFDRKGVFRIDPKGISVDDLELELIDAGLEEISKEDNEMVIYTKFSDFGAMQKTLEEKGMSVLSSEKHYIPNSLVELSEEQETEINELIEQIEEDDDVQTVYTNLK